MAGLRCSLESSGFPDFNHQTTHSLHQSKAELNANTSMRLRTSMTDRGWSEARDGGDAIAGSLETRKLTIQSTKDLKKSMGRKREGWQSHQCKEKRHKMNSKLRRWKAAKPRVLNSLCSSWRCLARSYDRKREEGKHGYTFIAPKRDDYGWKSRITRVDSVGDELISGSVTTGRRKTRLTVGVHTSATPERGACAQLRHPRPAHATATEERRKAAAQLGCPSRKRESRPAWFGSGGPLGHRATGKVSLFFLFFLI
jgi:hypothetical protein